MRAKRLLLSPRILYCPLADSSESGRIAYCFMRACIRKVRWLSMKDRVPSGRREFKPMEIPTATVEVGSSLRKPGEEVTPADPNKQIISGLYSREFFLTINQGKDNRNLTSFSFISFDKSLECEVAKLCHKSENEIDENDIKFFASKIKFNDLIPNSP